MTIGNDAAKLHMGRGMLNVDQRLTDFEGRLDATNLNVTANTTALAENAKKVTWVSPENFGAKGDGIADDTQALRDTFASKLPVKYKDGAVYRVTSGITITDQDVYWESEGKAKIINDTGGTLFSFSNSIKKTTAIVAGTILNSSNYTISLVDASNIQVGDLLEIKSNAPWYYDPRPDGSGGYSTYKGELHLVKAISGNSITLDTYINDNYASSETLAVYVFSPRRMNMKNIDIECLTNNYITMMYVYRYFKPTFENVHISNSQRAGIIIYESYAPHTTKCLFKCNIEDLTTIDTGYGIQEYGCVYGNHHHNQFVDCRRGIDFSGAIPSRFGVCDSNIFTSLGKSYVNVPGITGFGTHGGAEGISFTNNIINGAESAIKIRGNSCLIEGNIATNITDSFAYLEFGGESSVIGNTILSNDSGETSVNDIPNYFVTLADTKDNQRITVKGNVGVIKQHLVYHYCPTTLTMEINIAGNDVNTASAMKVLFISGIPAGQFFTLKNSSILDNQVSPDTKYKYNVDNMLVDWSTCDIQDYAMPSTSYSVVFGAGTMSAVSFFLLVTKRGKVVKLNGEFKFTVNTAALRPQITGLPNPNGGFNMSGIVLAADFTQHILYKVRNTDGLQISGSSINNTDTFASGTTNTVTIDFAYHMS